MGFRRRLKHKCGSEANWQGGVFSQGSLKMLKRILEIRYGWIYGTRRSSWGSIDLVSTLRLTIDGA